MSDPVYDTQQEAIVAALDDMEEGDTLIVHEQHCTGPDSCCCKPQRWTY